MANQGLNAVDNWRQLQRYHHADDHAAQAAKQPRQQTIPDENGTNKTVFCPQGTQDRDVATLVFYRHHQGRDDVEAGHADHQHHRQVHDGADHLDITIHITVSANPALDVDIAVGHFPGVAHQFVGVKDVVYLDGDPGDAAAHVQILTRIFQRHHGKAVIQLAAELQNAGHVQTYALRLL